MQAKLSERYPDIAKSGILKGNISWTKELAVFFHKAAMLRYFTPEHLHAINSRLGTEGAKDKIGKLVEMGYFARSSCLTITPKCTAYLNDTGYNTNLIQVDLRAGGARHELLISDMVLKHYMRFERFYYCLYPTFKALIPDACVLQKDGSQMTITFLEVEDSTKPRNYLDEKREKYRELARWPELHGVWWRDKADKLGLRFCEQKDFCFQVVYFSEETKWEMEKLV
jgi:hypothetical protein